MQSLELKETQDVEVCKVLLKAAKNSPYGEKYKSFTAADSRRTWIDLVLSSSLLPKDHYGSCLYARGAEGREDFRRFLDWHWQLPCQILMTKNNELSMQKSRFDDPKYCELVLAAVSDKQTQTTEGKTMSISIELTSQTLLNGQELANYSNQELYRIISKEEGYIAELKAVKAKPKRLVKEIEQRQAKLEELVALLDKQDGEDATQ